jgi:hypothetical protein
MTGANTKLAQAVAELARIDKTIHALTYIGPPGPFWEFCTLSAGSDVCRDPRRETSFIQITVR